MKNHTSLPQARVTNLGRQAALPVRRRTLLAGAGLLGAWALSARARASDALPASVRVAAPYVSLPMQVGIAQGYFAAEGLAVESTQFTSSRQAFQDLNAGLLDLLLTSADNPINYRLNPTNAVGGLLDVQIVFGHDLGFGVSLVAQPGFVSPEALRGQRLAVDAPDSGFAFTLYEMMRARGLEAGVDYTVVSAGAFPLRLAGLRAGDFEATVLNGDTLVRARSDGYAVLASFDDIVSPYMGGAGVARQTWLEANPEVAVRFIRAFREATRWLKDPTNRGAVIELLTDASTPPELAALIYESAAAPNGIAGDAGLNVPGLYNVLALRQEFGGFQVPQDLDTLIAPESGLYDLGYYERAEPCDPVPHRRRHSRPR